MLAYKIYVAAKAAAPVGERPTRNRESVLIDINMTLYHVEKVDTWIMGYADLTNAKRIRLRFRFTQGWETEMIFSAADWALLKPAICARLGLFTILESSMESGKPATHTAVSYNPGTNHRLEIKEFETGYRYTFGAGGLTVRHGTAVIDNQVVNKIKAVKG